MLGSRITLDRLRRLFLGSCFGFYSQKRKQKRNSEFCPSCMLSVLAYLSYLNVIWVQNLHIDDVYDNSTKNDTYHVGISIQRSSNLGGHDSDDINLYSFSHITNKFYENAKYTGQLIQEFKLFVQFMVHEFSIENLLFLFNIIQLKQSNESYWTSYKFEYSTKSIVELIENSKTKKKYNALIPFLDKIFFTF